MKRSATLAAILALGVAGCGQNVVTPSAAPPPARAVASPGCSSLTYGGPGRPQLLIALITNLQGQFADHGIQNAQAVKLALAQRGWHAGHFRVGLQVCDETSANSDFSDPAKCRSQARKFAGNRSIVAVLGPEFSSCAAQMLPILNTAHGGPVALISSSTTYLGLTRKGPGVAKGEPGDYFPTGTRSFVRLAPADDVQGAAAAMYVKSKGATRAFALEDGNPYGIGLAQAFATAAGRLDLPVAHVARWNPKAANYRALAARIAATRPDAVFLGGYSVDNAPRLIKDVRHALPRAQIVGPDGMNQFGAIVEGAGTAAEGFVATIAVEPASELAPPGRTFADQFRKRYGTYPCCFSVASAQTARMALDAVARVDGDRTRMAAALLGAHVTGGMAGDFKIDRYGDTSSTRIGVYRIRSGRGHYESSINPPASLLARH